MLLFAKMEKKRNGKLGYT